MTGLETPTAVDRPPTSAWVFAWLCLAGQLLQLALRGLDRSDAVWVLLSMAGTAVVLAWFASGVMRARTGRLVVVWILLGLGAFLQLVAVVGSPSGSAFLDLALTTAQLVALAVFGASDYVQRQRAPGAPRPDVAGLVWIAVVVGLLGGITAPVATVDTPIQLNIGL